MTTRQRPPKPRPSLIVPRPGTRARQRWNLDLLCRLIYESQYEKPRRTRRQEALRRA